MPCAKEGCKMRTGENAFCIHHRPDAEFPECSICLKAIRRSKDTLPCNHSFHAGCINYWFARSAQMTCPMCRAPAEDDPDPEPDWVQRFAQEIRQNAPPNATGAFVEINMRFTMT